MEGLGNSPDGIWPSDVSVVNRFHFVVSFRWKVSFLEFVLVVLVLYKLGFDVFLSEVSM